jgi:hypothetical protein
MQVTVRADGRLLTFPGREVALLELTEERTI